MSSPVNRSRPPGARIASQAALFLAVMITAIVSAARPAAADSFPVLNILTPTTGSMITQGPINFSYSTSDGTPPISVMCQIDNGASGLFDPCASSFSVPYLSSGTHSFLVQVTDATGNQMTSVSMFMTNLPDPPPVEPSPVEPLPVPATADPQPTTRCKRLTIIGVAGSGENGAGKSFRPQYGARVGSIRSELLDRLPTKIRKDTRSFPLNYPATEVRSTPGRLKYLQSENAGVVELASQLRNDPCGDVTRYVLIGYSQGSNVISDVLANDLGSDLFSRVVGVVLLADPVFSPLDDRITQLGSWSPSWAGALVNFKVGPIRGTSKTFPVYSYCRDDDAVCQSSKRNYVLNAWIFHPDRATSGHGTTIHGDYSMYTESAAKRLDKRIRSKVSAK